MTATNSLGAVTQNFTLIVAKDPPPDCKITSAPKAQAQAGKQFSFPIRTYGCNATITATGLPSWLKMTYGVLIGTSPVPGTYHFVVAATDDTGTVEQKFTLVVSKD